jgi:hypothetical protein
MRFLVRDYQIIKVKKEISMEEIKNKRWIRGSRTDIIREGDKIYYKICKCGVEKESYKMSMCRSCNRDYLNERNRSKKKCDFEIKDLVRKGKGGDKTLDRKKNFWSNKLIEFVNRVERRNGIASMEDIFVDMITLFNYYGCNQDIDILPTGIQLQMMWEYLSDYKKKIEKIKRKSIK